MDDYYCVEEFSDHEVIDSSSSDDEDIQSLLNLDETQEEEDFETEMQRERLNHVNGIHNSVVTSNTTNTAANSEESETNNTTNDDLLYDPQSDECDQKWVDRQRDLANSAKSGTKSMKSDATLNCPACMSLLCLDCQRHEIYRTQYRAMFVFNCRIDFSQRLQFKDKQKKRKRNQTTDETNSVEDYYPVFCEVCESRVAVYDSQEVYHFFGVLASF